MYTDDILGMLEDFDDLTTGGICSILCSSYAELRRRGSDWLPPDEFKAAQERSARKMREKEYQRVSNLLSYLQRKGFVEKGHNKVWKLTEKGIERLRHKMTGGRYVPISKYKKKEEEHLKIVIFDIPEQYKKRRDWLRFSLQNLGFSLLQKSVWIGRARLPEEFFQQLRELDLLLHVHIFSVQDAGSIAFEESK